MADHTATLRDKIRKAATADTRRTYALDGAYNVSDTLVIPSSSGFELRGRSMRGTRIRWHGPDDRPLFLRQDVRDSVIGNFTVEAVTPLASVFETGTVEPSAPGRTVCTNNHTRRLFVLGNNNVQAYAVYGGARWDDTQKTRGAEYPDINNEANVDEDVHANGVAYGIRYRGHQCKSNVVNRSRFFGQDVGVAAVTTVGGSFTSIAGGGSHFGSFYDLGDQTDSIVIIAPDVETCGRLMQTHGPNGKSGATQAIDIVGGKFMCDRLAPDADGRPSAILIQHGGIVKVRSIQLGSGNQPIPLISADGFRSVLSAHGVDFGAYGSTPGNSFYGGGDVYFDIGLNTYHGTDGDSYVKRGIPGLTEG